MPIESNVNYKQAQKAMEGTNETIYFQKLLILQREFMAMDYKDFVCVLGDQPMGSNIDQTEQFCFGIAQGIFEILDKYGFSHKSDPVLNQIIKEETK